MENNHIKDSHIKVAEAKEALLQSKIEAAAPEFSIAG